eukprot:1950532-Rhodomonas_salina.2
METLFRWTPGGDSNAAHARVHADRRAPVLGAAVTGLSPPPSLPSFLLPPASPPPQLTRRAPRTGHAEQGGARARDRSLHRLQRRRHGRHRRTARGKTSVMPLSMLRGSTIMGGALACTAAAQPLGHSCVTNRSGTGTRARAESDAFSGGKVTTIDSFEDEPESGPEHPSPRVFHACSMRVPCVFLVCSMRVPCVFDDAFEISYGWITPLKSATSNQRCSAVCTGA